MFFFSLRAQASIEYLLVVGISLLLISPIAVLFVYQSNSLSSEVNAQQLERIGHDVVSSAEEVFYLGPPSQKVLKAYFPEGLSAVSVYSNGVVFNLSLGKGVYSYPAYSSINNINLSGSISTFPGLHVLLIKAVDEGVVISEIT